MGERGRPASLGSMEREAGFSSKMVLWTEIPSVVVLWHLSFLERDGSFWQNQRTITSSGFASSLPWTLMAFYLPLSTALSAHCSRKVRYS